MPPQGEVARQWFIPGEGIDRGVITADIQRYLGNDATVRPGVGNGEYSGIQGYWIKAYRNFTSAMIQDLRADSQRWRQEQRQNGVTDGYVDSRTYNESNAGRAQRDGNSPSLDVYNAQPTRQRDGRQVDTRRAPPADAMQIDTPPGRAPPNQGYGPPQGYYTPDARGQYAPDPSRYPPQGRPGQGYAPEQPMADVYGQPDAYGRYNINHGQPDRSGSGYPPQNQGPPPGYTTQGNFYVPISTYSQQSGMVATSGPGYYDGQQPPPQRGLAQPNQRPPPGRDSYNEQNYGSTAYPSPAQTVTGPPDQFTNPPRSGYPPAQPGYDQYGNRPASGPTYPYQQEQPSYPPVQNRDGRGQPPSSQNERQGRGTRR